MQLFNIKFIADIHISPITISELNARGIDIKRVTEYLPANASDEQIIDTAIKNDSTIITQDLDFSNLIMNYGLKKPSIISIRIEKPFPLKVAELLPKIQTELQEGSIISLSEHSFRIRKLL